MLSAEQHRRMLATLRAHDGDERSARREHIAATTDTVEQALPD